MIRPAFLGRLRLRLGEPGRARLALGLGAAWAAAVLAAYYAQLWRALARLPAGLERPHFPGDPALPYLGEAALRLLSALSGAAFLLAAALLLGWAALRLAEARFDGPLEALPFAASLGIGIFAFTGLLLASFGLYRPELILPLAPALPLAAWGLVRLQSSPPLVGRPPLSASYRSPPRRPRRLEWAWLAAAGLGAALALLAALAPEREYDALWYHLQYPRLYLEQGRLVDLPWDYVSLYPMTWELWFGWGLALAGQGAAVLLHYACLPLVGLVVFLTARRFAPGASPWLALALFATIPTVLWEASTAYIDLALALHISLALYALLRYLEQAPAGRQWLLLAAANLGLALASKHLALIPTGLAVLGLALALRRRGLAWSAALPPALLLGGLALLPALPWYLRSFFAAGNPVFPELFWLFGAPPERWDAQTQAGLQSFLDRFGRPFSLAHLLSLPWHMTVHAEAYHGTLGPLFLILLPGLLLRRLRGGLAWLGLFALLYLVLWASPLSSQQMRFIVPLAPALAVLAAAAFARLSAAARLAGGRRLSALLGLGVFGLLLLNLPPFTALHERDRVEWQGWINSVLHGVEWGVVVGAESEQAYLSRQVRSYPAWSYANQHLPEQARLLTWAGGDQFYTGRDALWAYATLARPAAWPHPNPSALSELGLTHLLVDKETRQTWPAALLDPSSGWLELLHEDRWYALYRVNWERLP